MLLRKTFRFEASHILPKHKGKCSRLHGHSWVLHVEIEGQVDDETGFVMDYAEISEGVKPLIEDLDHKHLGAFPDWLLNNIPANNVPKGITVGFYPSSENLLLWIGFQLSGLVWTNLILEETCSSSATLTRKEFDLHAKRY